VRHPAHLSDVIAGLVFLKERYGMDDYILVGHSAGACLAFQSAQHVPRCRAVIGIEGIYDLQDLVQEYPDYGGFVESAFGSDQEIWTKASPIQIVTHWLDLSDVTVQLIQSKEDELLSPRQAEQFFPILQHTGVALKEIAWIKGTHNSSITSHECHIVVDRLISQLFET
jgi:kynurenine formamidase